MHKIKSSGDSTFEDPLSQESVPRIPNSNHSLIQDEGTFRVPFPKDGKLLHGGQSQWVWKPHAGQMRRQKTERSEVRAESVNEIHSETLKIAPQEESIGLK
ncbi:hypothetical protein TNCV_1541521 [Trichonephila clavipes]|nr:hypothetical protein TNCV_1541521 [Trichonephila clavipes]